MRSQNDFLSQRGVAIYLALAIMALFLALALGVSAILFGQMKTLTNIGFSVVAFYAVDSGIERELYFRTYLTALPGDSYADFLDFNGNGFQDGDDASYQVTIASISPVKIQSVGLYRGVRRAIEITF